MDRPSVGSRSWSSASTVEKLLRRGGGSSSAEVPRRSRAESQGGDAHDMERSPSQRRTLGRGVSMAVLAPPQNDDARGPDRKRSRTFCPLPRYGRARGGDDVSTRHDLLNAFAKFSPAAVHAELAASEAGTRSFRAASRKFSVYGSQSSRRIAFEEPSARAAKGALLFVDISGFTRLSTSLGIEALKRHINAIYARAVDVRAESQPIQDTVQLACSGTKF